MTDYDNRAQPSAGAGAAALLIALTVGGAAFLAATPQGKRLLEQLADLTEEWKTRAAAILAESREKVVSSVESRVPSEGDGRLREQL